MFNWLRKLFGDGKVRIELITVDGKQGQATAPFVGDVGKTPEKELLADIVNQIFVDKGWKIAKIRILGLSGSCSSQPNYSYDWFETSWK